MGQNRGILGHFWTLFGPVLGRAWPGPEPVLADLMPKTKGFSIGAGPVLGRSWPGGLQNRVQNRVQNRGFGPHFGPLSGPVLGRSWAGPGQFDRPYTQISRPVLARPGPVLAQKGSRYGVPRLGQPSQPGWLAGPVYTVYTVLGWAGPSYMYCSQRAWDPDLGPFLEGFWAGLRGRTKGLPSKKGSRYGVPGPGPLDGRRF